MTYQLFIRPEAEAEAFEGYQWYEEQRYDLGLEFVEALDDCFARVSDAPFIFAQIIGDVRRALLARFPYAVFYVVREERITVLAILHQASDPTSWPGI